MPFFVEHIDLGSEEEPELMLSFKNDLVEIIFCPNDTIPLVPFKGAFDNTYQWQGWRVRDGSFEYNFDLETICFHSANYHGIGGSLCVRMKWTQEDRESFEEARKEWNQIIEDFQKKEKE